MKKPNNTNSKVFFHPVVITVNLLLLLLLGNAWGIGSTGSAQTTPPAAVEPTSEITQVEGTLTNKDMITAELCIYELTKFADPEFESYKSFMEDNFKNKSATSSLLNLGIQRYDQFKSAIRGKLELQVGEQLRIAGQAGATAAAQFPSLARCESKAAEYIDNASKLLQMRAYATSSIKKTSLFVEKYKQINTKLRSLDLDFMRMVINIRTFEEKLPCYLKSCI